MQLIHLLLLILLLTVVLWWRLRPPRRPLFRLLGVLLVLALTAEAVGMVSRSFVSNNAPIYNTYLLLECWLVLTMAHTVLPRLAPWLWAGAGAGLLAFIGGAYVHSSWDFLFIETILVFAVILTIVSMRVLWHLAQHSTRPVQHLPEFWLFMGLLIYAGGLVPTVGTVRLVYATDEGLASRMWSLVVVLAIVRYGLTAVACAMEHSQRKKHVSRQ